MNNHFEKEAQARIDFELPPSPKDFVYYYTVAPNPHNDYLQSHVLKPAFEEVFEKYGIEVQPLAWGVVPEIDHRIPYVIVAGVNPLDWMSNEPALQHLVQFKHLEALAAVEKVRVNVVCAFPYDSDGDSQEYRNHAHRSIPALDKVLGINTIFADHIDSQHGIRTITARDLADNIVCETIRVKYHGLRESNIFTVSVLEFARRKYRYLIEEIRSIFDQHRLYHRAPTDGAILIKMKKGWLVSQTKTDKTQMTARNFSCVFSYSAENNTITYEGSKLPSSDAPELMIMAESLGDVPEGTIVVHCHQKDVTRGGFYPDHLTQNIIEYGLFESGREMAAEMRRIGDNWMILREHGLVAVAKDAKEFEELVKRILAKT